MLLLLFVAGLNGALVYLDLDWVDDVAVANVIDVVDDRVVVVVIVIVEPVIVNICVVIAALLLLKTKQKFDVKAGMLA